MEQSLELAKMQLKAVVTQVQSFLDINQIICVGPFFFTYVQEVKYFGALHRLFCDHPLRQTEL